MVAGSGNAAQYFKRLREEYAEICVPTLVLSEKQVRACSPCV